MNLVDRTALIDINDKSTDLKEILTSLEKRGFQAKVRQNAKTNNSFDINASQEWWKQWRQLMVSLCLLLLSVLGHLAEAKTIAIPLLGNLIFHASLATFALFGPGLKILKSGWNAVAHFSPNMDSLVGIGVSSAYLTSLSALIWPQMGWPCFFNEPVMLLGFVLLGRFLEERARLRTGKALKELAKLQPQNARLINKNNQIKDVRVGALQPGERIQLLAGDRVPVDGVVIEGNSTVDVSNLTGESLPLETSPGTELSSGSLNLEGTLIVEVQRVGAETALARIIGLVEKAQARKAPIQNLADKVAGKFCYGVVTLSFFTFIFWWRIGAIIWPQVLNTSGQGLMHMHGHMHNASLGTNAQTPLGLAVQLSIAVLVVACPCALGLATPTVITVASGKAAKRGWLFKGGDVIEKAALIKQIVFDKTGTLTVGRPEVIGYLGTEDPDELIQIAASLEENSRHPIAFAILQTAQSKGINLLTSSKVNTIPGKGISGYLDNIDGAIMVGTIEWLKSEGVNYNLDIEKLLEESNFNEKSIVAVSINKKLKGLIIIDDQIRNDVKDALTVLRKKGLLFKNT